MPTKPMLVIALLLLVIAACGAPNQSSASPSAIPVGSGVPSSAPPASTSATSPESITPAAAMALPSAVEGTTSVQQPNGTFLFTPGSARIRGGVLYAYVAFTHCGFTPTTFDFDGSFWAPQAAGVAGNPPPGIGNPEDAGTIALVSPNEAVFTSQAGILVPLIRIEGPQAGFPCD